VRGMIALVAAVATLACCSPRGEPTELALRLRPGTSMRFVLSASQDISQSIGGRTLVVTQETRAEYRLEVREALSDGRLAVHALYEAIALSTRSPARILSWDSRAPDKGTAGLGPMRELVGEGFDFIVSPRGEVEEVRGVERLAERFAGGSSEGGAPNGASSARWLNRESVASDLALFFCPYPGGKVALGESWQTERGDGSGLGLRIRNTWRLVRRSKGTAEVALVSEVSPGSEPASASGLSGMQQGTFTVHPGSGRVLSARIDQAIGGTIVVRGVPVAMDIKSRIRVIGE
jgi:hypothetical protein